MPVALPRVFPFTPIPRRPRPAASRPRLPAWSLLVAALLLAPALHPRAAAADPSPAPARTNLVQAVLSEDLEEQQRLLQGLAAAGAAADPFVAQALVAWRGGAVYLYETNDTRIPILLDSQTDAEGQARALRLLDGQTLNGPDGAPLFFGPTDLATADASSRLRRAIKATLDLLALSASDPAVRRDAIVKLGQEQNPEYLAAFETRLTLEPDPPTRRALEEAIATTQLVSEDAAVREAAIRKLGAARSIQALAFLQQLRTAAANEPARYGPATLTAARQAVREIEDYIRRGNLVGTAFRGLSLAAVLLVAALGLAITFGLMGIINMAHGELIMVGAYTTYVTQNYFAAWFGTGTTGFDVYFLAALPASFAAAGLVGLLLERGVIRFLYRRPLESLLATWGVSLVLQQVFRHIFGAANVQVSSPRWLSGSLVITDVLFAYNRLFVIAFALLIVLATYLLLTRTSFGLQIRAVMQNRSMASALGVRTDRVNLVTFAFGSGLAGVAGACLSQIGNVGPSLGQNYIVDCFMVVVLGGVGNLVGTVAASLGIGVTDQILQPWLGAVLGKITVLAAIILFLQWRPAGLFVTRSRSLEG